MHTHREKEKKETKLILRILDYDAILRKTIN